MTATALLSAAARANPVAALASSARRLTVSISSSSASASSSSSSRWISSSAATQQPAHGAQGDFARPASAPTSTNLPTASGERNTAIAQPHTPETIPSEQAPNYPSTWSANQNARENAMRGPRFEQMEVDFQPQPLSAMAMIQKEPVRLSSKRVVSCDGGGGALGHPKIFINLDKPGPKACTYCGVRYELDHGAHH
ncbi:hypothetical protein OC846_000820 [Tilletia horrida]|uniref:Zinc finger CHCC-type domain-containing protein n=1 Tax=Tilletia horrida TaxID=155126 RepID=A0AAN6GXJ2_9BASI|nr:hypothetical protein OC845_002338 [Tilletia horrida]KAK0556976.1 hypothetical protein OC846_000820 [Tilletia horrida]KAK0566670.1 hypothetical protein OC861_003110 [Tilletia horrida]